MPISKLFDISGKTALVTGGSRGIGLMIARGFVEAGVKVYISSRNAKACAEAAEELNKIGTCIALPHDLGTTAEVKKLAEEVKSREKKLDFLINNAGAAWAEPFETYSEAGWDKLMNVNLKAVGLNGLLDKLMAMGLIPEDQMMGARMMLGMFAKVVEGEPDTMTSAVEFKDKHLFVNGMQLQ